MTAQSAQTQASGKPLPVIDAERCIGCGICAYTCGKKALTMVRRTRQPRIPENSLEKVIRMMLERGRLPHLLFDQSMGRSSRFLNRLIAALCALPPMEKLLAGEQLQSRFVRFVLSRIKDPTV
jgi:ferredoxin